MAITHHATGEEQVSERAINSVMGGGVVTLGIIIAAIGGYLLWGLGAALIIGGGSMILLGVGVIIRPSEKGDETHLPIS